jgi:hypothetical protein
MNLIQIATGAAVISTPLWAMAFMQGDRPGDAWFDTNAIQAEGLAGDGYFSWHDYTNDGLADALHHTHNGAGISSITLFIGLGNGEFLEQPPVILDHGVGGGPISQDSADVNGDGYLDLVYSNEHRGSPVIFLNTGGTGFRCAGDVDGDGQTRVEDLVGLLEDWGCDDSAQ